MMKRHDVYEKLHSYKNKEWEKQRIAAAKKLPGSLKKIAIDILKGPEFSFAPEDQRKRQSFQKALISLAKLSEGNRRKIFLTLYPKLARYVEVGWNLHDRLPYQLGMTRKAFRAPNYKDLLISKKIEWLGALHFTLSGYDQDIEWVACWAPYLGFGQNALGLLLAGAIEVWDESGQAVYDILIDSANGEHEIGIMGHHIPSALLVASRPEGWQFIQNMLLAAQRQEGLRQSILEVIDLAHPDAFLGMLRTIMEHNLVRFAAVVRAIDVWFGFKWDSANTKIINEIVSDVLRYLKSQEECKQALNGNDPHQAYLALWAMAFYDAPSTIKPAAKLLNNDSVEFRFISVHFLRQLGIPQTQEYLFKALGDEELQIVYTAFLALKPMYQPIYENTDLFERIERILPRLPNKMERKSLVWPWMSIEIKMEMVYQALVSNLGKRSPLRLLPHLDKMAPRQRRYVIEKLARYVKPNAEVRRAILDRVGDRSPWVRERAIEALKEHAEKFSLKADEVRQLEGLLRRKATDLRRGIFRLLLTQTDSAVLESAERLLWTNENQMRLAGLELLRQMNEGGRSVHDVNRLVRRFKLESSRLSEVEDHALSILHSEVMEVPTLEDGLGLFDPADLTSPLQTQKQPHLLKQGNGKSIILPQTKQLLGSLDDRIDTLRNEVIQIPQHNGVREELLGNLNYYVFGPNPNTPLEEDLPRFFLRDAWEDWWRNAGNSIVNSDPIFLLFGIVTLRGDHRVPYFRSSREPWEKKVMKEVFGEIDSQSFKYPLMLPHILEWLLRINPPDNAASMILDAVEHTFASVPKDTIRRLSEPQESRYYGYSQTWRDDPKLLGWVIYARTFKKLCPSHWTGEHHIRFFKLLRWLDQPLEGVPRHLPGLTEVLEAYQHGGATKADLIDNLMNHEARSYFPYVGGADLGTLSGLDSHPLKKNFPVLKELVPLCRQRVVEVELDRGDLPTVASNLALSLRYTGGMDVLFRLLDGFRKYKFTRGYAYDSKSKAVTFSKMIRSTIPDEGISQTTFANMVSELKIKENRLLELAVYAPQWAKYVEETLGWVGLVEGVWWLHAHTKDNRWYVPKEVRDLWMAEISLRTPLSGQDLLDGGVDVDWFHQVFGALGLERWIELYKAAKYTSGGRGHTRAKMFADAMTDRLDRDDLVTRITKKRNQDAVRALGLINLPEGSQRDIELLDRYNILQEFLRGSRKFGAQRKASEKLAVRIGMENLARTAGYPDPRRLEWAMEVEDTDEMKGGSVSATADDITLTLAITEWGKTNLDIYKNEKKLKRVPPRVKKLPEISHILELQKKVKKQASRMRASLEEAMIRGDIFTTNDFDELLRHTVLGPMLAQLLFVCDKGVGFLTQKGKSIKAYSGDLIRIPKTEKLRIAHPYDLLMSKKWHIWQKECFLQERIQPFKQIFREVYVLSEAECKDKSWSQRYAGQQVNPKQALALLGQRGWISHYDQGIHKTFHKEGITAHLSTLNGWFTPAEVDGLTIEHVFFSPRGKWQPIDLKEVPPRLFSEVMRDLDLVVSVAHRGGVDPEASASTIEMRFALLRETLDWLQLTNVDLKESWALIEGQLCNYNVHLGSGVVHMQPGGALCIIPVHSQHRGRIFLPFADDDPKTAEVISKVLLLAEDKEIKDPTILEQITLVR